MYQLILGSASPRREELLKWSYLNFKVIKSTVDEEGEFKDPVHMVEELARMKAQDVYSIAKEKYQSPFVIGADTIVVADNEVLGKPVDRNHAKKMLSQLSGREHLVYTGVCFAWAEQICIFHEKTSVLFETITQDMMEHYLDTSESLDKAGAYGIQGAALGFIKSLNGSYSNVVGLPLDKLIGKLKEVLNFKEDEVGEWRKLFI